MLTQDFRGIPWQLGTNMNSSSISNSLLMKTTCWWAASKVQTINTQHINNTQNIKYKTDKLNKAKIIKKTKTKQKSLTKITVLNEIKTAIDYKRSFWMKQYLSWNTSFPLFHLKPSVLWHVVKSDICLCSTQHILLYW